MLQKFIIKHGGLIWTTSLPKLTIKPPNDKLSPEWYQISQAHRIKERSLCSVWEGDTSVCGENRGQGCRNKLSSIIKWLEWFLWCLNEVNTGNDHSTFLVNNLALMMYLNLPSHFIPDYSHCQLYCLPSALISDRPNLMSPCRAVVQGRKGECCYFSETWLWLSFCKTAQCFYTVGSLCSPLNSHSPYPAAHCLSPREHSVYSTTFCIFGVFKNIWVS